MNYERRIIYIRVPLRHLLLDILQQGGKLPNRCLRAEKMHRTGPYRRVTGGHSKYRVHRIRLRTSRGNEIIIRMTPKMLKRSKLIIPDDIDQQQRNIEKTPTTKIMDSRDNGQSALI